jgi:hypothetical protein
MSEDKEVICVDLMEKLDGLTISEAIKFLADFPFDSKISQEYIGDEYHGYYSLEIVRKDFCK